MKYLVPLLLLAAAPAAAKAHKPGESFRDARDAPAMVVVPAGHVLLGSPEAETTREGRPATFAAYERPQREVSFDRPFAVGKYHVTRGEFAAFVQATKRPMDGCVVVKDAKWSDGPQPGYDYRHVGHAQHDDEPALCVNWADAQAYTDWLSARTHARYRLLSEAEWEYAARGGTTTARWWGDDTASICAHANGGDRDYAATMPDDKGANLSCADGFARTSPAGHFPPNPFGLYDMLGNAWQWVADCFTPVPGAPPPSGPCAGRSIRGGSWHNGTASLRPAVRFSLPPTMRSSSLGFRVMRELP
jgi:formylglycine-generating enzyme required for sulfatase activity